MSETTRMMCGIILLTVPTIEYGGSVLLRLSSGGFKSLDLTPFQRSMFRAGHAHAGVLVLLALICQPLTDHAGLSPTMEWAARITIPLAAILISGGFFGAAAGRGRTTPGPLIALVYGGAISLAFGLITLGLGLVMGG